MSNPNPSSQSRGRLLSRIKPSYLVLLALAPLVILLFVQGETYRDALAFIWPGVRMTFLLTLVGYAFAFFWGLALAGMQFLKMGKHTLWQGLSVFLLIAGIGASLLFLPKQTYVLVGAEDDGRVAVVKGTPRPLIEAVKLGTYREGGEPRAFRAVPDAEAALERLERGLMSAALLPEAALQDEMTVLWEQSVVPETRRNFAFTLIALGFFGLLLVFAGWQSGENPLAIFAELYIDLIRGLPMLVVILFIGLVLPGELQKLNLLIEPNNEFLRNLQRGAFAIGLGYAAYMAEIFRAGIQAIPKGQYEAADALGLAKIQTVRFIILPQALRVVIPPLGNEFVAMLKDTALISVIGAGDITRKAREYGASTLNNLPPYYTAAIIYIALTLTTSSILKTLERRMDKGKRR